MKKFKFFTAIGLVLLFAFPAQAAVSSETTRVKYTCNGTTTVYAYPFKVLEDDDLLAVKAVTATGAESTLVLNTDYTVTGAGGSGGNLVLTAGSKCGSGYTLTILRNIELTQETDYVDGQAFSAESLETAIDKVTLIQQQQAEQIGRAPKLPKTSSITDIALPNPAANNLIGWNPAGTALINRTDGITLTTATGYEVDALVTYGGGTAFTQATIESALTAVGTVNKVTLLLRPGTWVISSNADWSAYTNVTFKIVPGAVISHGAFTISIGGQLSVELNQIFSGTGAVTLGNRSVDFIRPEWFGAAGNGITDDHAAFEQAYACMVASCIATLKLSQANYYFADYVEIAGSGMERPTFRISGEAMAGYVSTDVWKSEITGLDGLTTLFLISANLFSLEVDHVKFRSSSATTGVVSAIKFTGTGAARAINIHHSHFSKFEKAIWCYKGADTAAQLAYANIVFNTFHTGNYAFFSEGAAAVINGLNFSDNISEVGGRIRIQDNGAIGTLTIERNILEAQSNPIYITGSTVYASIKKNYFEACTGRIIHFASTNGAAELILEGNLYSSPNTDVYIYNSRLVNRDNLTASLILLRANLLRGNSLLNQSAVYLPATGDVGIANTVSWEEMSRYEIAASAAKKPNFIKTGTGSAFFVTPRGDLRGYETVTTASSAWVVTDATGIAVDDYVVGNVLFRKTASTTNRWVNIKLLNSAGDLIGEIGESLFYPFYSNVEMIVPVQFAIKATNTSAATYKIQITAAAGTEFDVSDFYIWRESAATAATTLVIRLQSTRKMGAATIALNGTSVTVTHGMPYIPYSVRVTPNVNVGFVWVDTIGATTFVINCSSNSHAETIAYWEAY